jgi:hypothetical protein
MSDPLRTDTTVASSAVSDPERDAKIEHLLLRGLDRYFAGEYEQAINIWTRVLFLDRSHARARAYIDRARSALAERQRESEELLQNGVDAFHRGEGEEARRLLDAALHRGAPADQALAVIDRLNRLEQGQSLHTPSPRADDARTGVIPDLDVAATRARSGLLGWITLASALGACAFLVAGSDLPWFSDLVTQPLQGPVQTSALREDLPLPRRGEMALERARMLAARGRLHDAMAALDQIRPTDAEKVEADRLRGDVQRQLIGLLSGAPPEQLESAVDDAIGGR